MVRLRNASTIYLQGFATEEFNCKASLCRKKYSGKNLI